MNRVTRLLGVVLIALLWVGEASSAQEQEEDLRCRRSSDDCTECLNEDDCFIWICPIGHEDGAGMSCPEN